MLIATISTREFALIAVVAGIAAAAVLFGFIRMMGRDENEDAQTRYWDARTMQHATEGLRGAFTGSRLAGLPPGWREVFLRAGNWFVGVIDRNAPPPAPPAPNQAPAPGQNQPPGSWQQIINVQPGANLTINNPPGTPPAQP